MRAPETMPSLRCEEPTWTPTVDFFLSPPDTTAASESAPLVQAEGSAADSSASLASLCFCLSASTTSLDPEVLHQQRQKGANPGVRCLLPRPSVPAPRAASRDRPRPIDPLPFDRGRPASDPDAAALRSRSNESVRAASRRARAHCSDTN